MRKHSGAVRVEQLPANSRVKENITLLSDPTLCIEKILKGAKDVIHHPLIASLDVYSRKDSIFGALLYMRVCVERRARKHNNTLKGDPRILAYPFINIWTMCVSKRTQKKLGRSYICLRKEEEKMKR